MVMVVVMVMVMVTVMVMVMVMVMAKGIHMRAAAETSHLSSLSPGLRSS
jgi:ABC-type lipoprotein release transport system permease subunit